MMDHTGAVVGPIIIFLLMGIAGLTVRQVIFIAMLVTTFITVDSGLRYILPSCRDGKKRSVMERLIQHLFGVGAREA